MSIMDRYQKLIDDGYANLAALFYYECPHPKPKRCRVCGGVLDTKYKERHRGYLCLECDRQVNRQRAKKFYHNNSDKAKEYNKGIPRYKTNARAHANFKHPVRQVCSVYGCNRMGVRHHPDYNKPAEIVWLCPIHHYKEHHGA